jgi:hypothetical protein
LATALEFIGWIAIAGSILFVTINSTTSAPLIDLGSRNCGSVLFPKSQSTPGSEGLLKDQVTEHHCRRNASELAVRSVIFSVFGILCIRLACRLRATRDTSLLQSGDLQPPVERSP